MFAYFALSLSHLLYKPGHTHTHTHTQPVSQQRSSASMTCWC